MYCWRATLALPKLFLVEVTSQVIQTLLRRRARAGSQDLSGNKQRQAIAIIIDCCPKLLQYLTPPGFLFTINRRGFGA